ncbi:MAG: efflux RND transporter periplasmic adaptor subunit [Candidatus Acidiferrales bacterium]
MTSRQIRLLALLASAFTCGFAISLGGCSHGAPDDRAGDASVNAEVTVTKVVRADISQTVQLTGTAAALPNDDVKVSALVAGRIAELKVAEGDRVHAGEILAQLDDHSYHDQLRQAEAAEQQAKANIENAQLTEQRNQDLFQRGIAARKDLEDAKTQQSVAAAALQQAEAALSIARLQLARTEIASPLNGIVAKRFASVGEQVDGTAAQPIVEVANIREIEFLGNAPAMYLGKMRRGEVVDVTSDALPGRKFQGHVVAISPSVDPSTGVGLARIDIPNSDGQLRLGIFLSANIPIATRANALCVPPQAVYRDESGQTRVYVVKGGTATAVPVTLGIETKNLVQLSSGATEGETVILTGGYGLPDTAKVQIQSQTAQ